MHRFNVTCQHFNFLLTFLRVEHCAWQLALLDELTEGTERCTGSGNGITEKRRRKVSGGHACPEAPWENH